MLRQSLAFIILLAFLTCYAHAGTPASFTGANNGNWNLATNWSTNPTIPLNSGANTFDVTITNKTVNYNVAGTNAIQSLTLSGATLKLLSGDNLSVVSGVTSTTSTINVTGAAFSAAGSASFGSASLLVSGGGSISLLGLTASGGGTLQIDGATSSFSLANLASINLNGTTSTLKAQNAGDLELGALATFTATGNGSESATLTATGANSILRANALTSFATAGAPVTLQALSGGLTELTSLTSASGNALLTLQATGANSVLNLPALAKSQSNLHLSVQTGGTLQWGHVAVLNSSTLTLDTSGTLDTSFLTNIDATSLTATNGATLSIPVTTWSATSGTQTWQATNANSKLLLPNLTTLTLFGGNLNLTATNGGDVELPALTTANLGTNTLTLQATGANSVINLPLLSSSLSHINVTTSAGGTVLWGTPTALLSSSITFDGSGTLNLSAFTNINGTSVTVSNMAALSFPLVTSYQTVSGASATLQATGTNALLSFPALTTLSNPGNVFSSLTFRASGTNALVALNALTSLTADAASMTFQAQNGGTIQLNALTQFTNLGNIFGSITFAADGASTKVNLPLLATIALNGAANTLRATQGGDLEAPNLAHVNNTGNVFENQNIQVSDPGSLINVPLLGTTPLSRLTISLNGGTILWGNPTVLQASSVTVDTSGSITLPQLVNIDSTSFNAANGVNITLPNVTTLGTLAGTGSALQATGNNSTFALPALTSIGNAGDVFSSISFSASGTGSLVSLPVLQTVTANSASITFQAKIGGTLQAPALTNISNLGSIFGSITFAADGANAKVNLPLLATIALNGAANTIRATGGGDVEAPNLATVSNTGNIFESQTLQTTDAGSLINVPLLGLTPLARITVSMKGGTILWGNPTVLKASSVTIDTSGSITLPQLTNIDDTSFNAANGVTISLPNVTAYSTLAGNSATLQATGGNSTLSLPALATLTNPGDVFSSVTLSASGSGSTVSLPALQTATANAATLSFEAHSGGTLHADALTTASNLGSIFGNFNATADGAGSKLTMAALTTMHLNGATNNLHATNGGDLELPAITTVTSTGNIFESFNVQSSGPGSLVNLSSLGSTLGFPDSLALSNGGELDLAGLHSPFALTFLANFSASSSGSLDVYLNHVLLTHILPNNTGSSVPYQLNVSTVQAGASVVEFIATGAANVTLQDYNTTAPVPEPASMLLLSLLAPNLLRRHRPYRLAQSPHL